ncbi:MAG: N-acetylglutamate synthase-like GNAT family acetyltransferase [Planctomycetota bacterium]|jgi:N-acetylglutamate synthase-like GNAT family acetyltransferase
MPFRFIHELTDDHVVQLHALFSNEWWTKERSLTDVRKAVETTPFLFAMVEAESDRLIAFARVLSDEVFKALIMDVVVHPDFRDQGLGQALMNDIASHPALKSVHHFELYCLEEMAPYYERWGFTTQLGAVRFMRSDSFGS